MTDGTGQYKIVDLRPGSYTITFALQGFSTVKREGLELSGAFTATVNADLRVGAVEETITVSGETPIVDIQSTTRQQVLDHGVIDAVPTGRLVQNLGVLLPGVSVSGGLTLNGVGTQDVGGSSGNAVSQLASHGGRGLDQRTAINGLSMMLSAGVNNTPYVPNMGSTQEVTIDTSGVSAEAAEGGVRVTTAGAGSRTRAPILMSSGSSSSQARSTTSCAPPASPIAGSTICAIGQQRRTSPARMPSRWASTTGAATSTLCCSSTEGRISTTGSTTAFLT